MGLSGEGGKEMTDIVEINKTEKINIEDIQDPVAREVIKHLLKEIDKLKKDIISDSDVWKTIHLERMKEMKKQNDVFRKRAEGFY
jgi:hypothetical protein